MDFGILYVTTTEDTEMSGCDPEDFETIAPENKESPGRKYRLEEINPIMKFFEYDHLPKELQAISMTICQAAHELNDKLPDSYEKLAGLRRLLEAKDCFVRAAYLKDQN